MTVILVIWAGLVLFMLIAGAVIYFGAKRQKKFIDDFFNNE